MSAKVLGPSIFNYKDYTACRFISYYQQIRFVLSLAPRKMLEIGPGDHAVSDFLIRKGIDVKTLDNDPDLFPDYHGDLRSNLEIREQFDLVLACEVFEHMNLKWLDRISQNIKKLLVPGGHLVVSVPYSTLRLFPARSDYGKIVSCEGRLHTYIPFWVVQPLIDVLQGLYRLAFQRCFRSAFRFFKLPDYPDDFGALHHWDVGYGRNIRKIVRDTFAGYFSILEEKTYHDTNCVFWILKNDK